MRARGTPWLSNFAVICTQLSTPVGMAARLASISVSRKASGTYIVKLATDILSIRQPMKDARYQVLPVHQVQQHPRRGLAFASTPSASRDRL